MSWQKSTALVWDAERLRLATDAAEIALWSWNADTDEIVMDERAHGLWGIPRNASVTFEILSGYIHSEDLGRARKAFTATRSNAGAYEVDFRILHHDGVRWISARGQSKHFGIVERMIFGVFLDVTDRKQAEETREMLVGEMNHRIKNLFALASALTGLAARSAATTAEMAQDLRERLTALGRAHNLVCPVSGQDDKALLGGLLTVLLAPYSDQKAVSGRVHISVPEVPIGKSTATTLALIVHELATNSVKYGALSSAGGTLDVSCADNGDNLVILWTEQGGPPVLALTGALGFGSKLVGQSVGQIGGAIAYDWDAQGVTITLQMSKARLGA